MLVEMYSLSTLLIPGIGWQTLNCLTHFKHYSLLFMPVQLLNNSRPRVPRYGNQIRSPQISWRAGDAILKTGEHEDDDGKTTSKPLNVSTKVFVAEQSATRALWFEH